MSKIATNLNEILTDMIEDYEETSLTLAELLEEIDTYIDSMPDDNSKNSASQVLQGLISSIIENIIGGESESEEDDE